jgi:predicted GNAT family N-acyltransferase
VGTVDAARRNLGAAEQRRVRRRAAVEVRVAQSEEELAAAFDLRERVFYGEQGVSPAADRDGRDTEATHVVAVDGRRVVGTCRLLFRGPVARLGRLAVEPERRGEGIAAAILAEADRVARARRAEAISLHAQTYAKQLYLRAGYGERGPHFVEEGIEHVAMEKRLRA